MYFLNKHAGMGSAISPAGILKQIHIMQVHKFFIYFFFKQKQVLICSLYAVFVLSIFTCKRSDSGMSECSSRMEVFNSLLVLATMALLVLPLPALFAMTCSDRRRSCDSSGMSRRRKTTSKRESKAEPILNTRTHNCETLLYLHRYLHLTNIVYLSRGQIC